MLINESLGAEANVKNIGFRFDIRFDIRYGIGSIDCIDGSLTQMMKRKKQCTNSRVFPDTEMVSWRCC